MRFSIQKTAHAALSSAANRKSGYAPYEQTVLPVKLVAGRATAGPSTTLRSVGMTNLFLPRTLVVKAE